MGLARPERNDIRSSGTFRHEFASVSCE